jgi:HPt (histidine-containing phosphotransfer) domain-containing protein
VARRDISGAVDFAYLEGFAAGDETLIDEVLAIFREQAGMWAPMLDPASEGWRDAVHTIKGASRGVGAFRLGDECERCEARGGEGLPDVRYALDVALMDIAAYAHERALKSLRG